MKNGRKSIVCSTFVVLLFAVIALVFCMPFKSAKAENAETEQLAEDVFVINKYNDGQAYLDEENNVVIESAQSGQVLALDNGAWYTDGISDGAVMDTDECGDAEYVYLNSSRELTAAYYGENGECNIINADVSVELAENKVDKCIVFN